MQNLIPQNYFYYFVRYRTFRVESRQLALALTSSVAGKISPLAQSRFLFPHNWIRGYTDFEVAPSHNEPDLGRCAFPQPLTSGGINSTCTAYARWMISGYL